MTYQEKLEQALMNLVTQVEEDVPKQNMSRHLIDAIEESVELLKERQS